MTFNDVKLDMEFDFSTAVNLNDGLLSDSDSHEMREVVSLCKMTQPLSRWIIIGIIFSKLC